LYVERIGVRYRIAQPLTQLGEPVLVFMFNLENETVMVLEKHFNPSDHTW